MIASLVGLAILLPSPPSASQVLSNAQIEAKREGKNIFAYFGASWCSWCRKTDGLLTHPEFAAKFSDSYVIAKITIRERQEKRLLENAGWESVLASLRGAKDRDVPYYVILDPKGKKLGDGYRFGEGKVPNNGGYPQTGPEVDAFVDLIRQTGKAFSVKDLSRLKAYFLLQ